jgi:hypothetical protein
MPAADGAFMPNTTPTLTIADVTPTFVLTLAIAGTSGTVPPDRIASLVASLPFMADAIATIVRTGLYPHASPTFAPDPIDLLAKLGIEVRAFDSEVAGSELGNLTGMFGGGRHFSDGWWSWARLDDGGLMAFVEVAHGEHSIRRSLTHAVGQAALNAFGVDLENENDLGRLGEAIGLGLLASDATVMKAIGGFGECFTHADFARAANTLRDLTHIHEDDCTDIIADYALDHYGHVIYECPPLRAMPPREAA